MTLPITGLSNSFDCIVLVIAWRVVSARSKEIDSRTSPALTHIRSYLAYFALFNVCMALPFLVLYLQSDTFPAAMGWGYTVANVFLLISLSHISRVVFKLVPRLTKFDRLAQAMWIVFNVIMTGLNVYFVALHNNPTFSKVTGITQFHFPSFLGPVLGTISLLAYVPAIVLFGISTFDRFNEKRLRSALLLVGFIIIMIVGPLHAAAKDWKLFVLADVMNMISLALITAGVLYKLASSESVANVAQSSVSSKVVV
jgi:hypothetical protein